MKKPIAAARMPRKKEGFIRKMKRGSKTFMVEEGFTKTLCPY